MHILQRNVRNTRRKTQTLKRMQRKTTMVKKNTTPKKPTMPVSPLNGSVTTKSITVVGGYDNPAINKENFWLHGWREFLFLIVFMVLLSVTSFFAMKNLYEIWAICIIVLMPLGYFLIKNKEVRS